MGERADRAAHGFLLVALLASATVIAGVITWVAVARLGHEATAGSQSTLTQSDVRRELDRVVGPSPPSSGTTPSKGPASTGPASTGPASTDLTTPGRPPDPARHSMSWNVTGGHLVATCQGEVIRITYATPGDGWGMRVNDSGPDKVSVEFSRGDSDSKLEATCSGGVPVLKDDD